MIPLGVIACGHEETAKAAEGVLREGGNAFDAVVAAHFSACVSEPILASLGGGGFLLAHTASGKSIVYDFFVQTPRKRRSSAELDFYPIHANFGLASQEFHIGYGAAATPGAVKGLFAIHRDLCTMPIGRLIEPAVVAARRGIVVNAFQAYVFDIVKPILAATPEAASLFHSRRISEQPLREGELFLTPQLADTLEALASEGDRLFYQGEIAQLIADCCYSSGGHLTREDLSGYRVIRRKPLQIDYRGTKILTNPPPSSGGLLIGFALKLLEGIPAEQISQRSGIFLLLLAHAMELTNKARLDQHLDDPTLANTPHLLDPDYLNIYQQQIYRRAACLRGTTHISILDHAGNIASMSISNGEGCGAILGNTGIMLNNMLGEEDLNPGGFHRWATGQRMTSMMAPSLLRFSDGRAIALGSGGSNRIRTAILQVLINLIDRGLPLDSAITRPRIHHENDLVSIEAGLDKGEIAELTNTFTKYKVWDAHNLFFGGVHGAASEGNSLFGAGDPRRGGVASVVYGARTEQTG